MLINLTHAELTYIITKLGGEGPSTIRPGDFTGQEALALREKLQALKTANTTGVQSAV